MSTDFIATIIWTVVSTAAALITLTVDRSAQAQAWRRIADERRWNHHHRTSGSAEPTKPW